MTNFQRGDQVEVCCKDDGFNGAYYSATVIAKINPNEYIVQYDTLLRNDELAPLREMVSPFDLRPVPPEIPIDGFDLKDVVDVFANDGWWVGKVTKKTHGRKLNKRYYVHFEGSDEVGRYSLSDLRVHQEWVHGNWSCSKKFL